MIIHIKTKHFSGDIANDVEKSFDRSRYEVIRPFLIAKNIKFLGIIKGKLTEVIMKEFFYDKYDEKKEEKTKGTKNI